MFLSDVHSTDPAAKGMRGRQETEQALYGSTLSDALALAHTQQLTRLLCLGGGEAVSSCTSILMS